MCKRQLLATSSHSDYTRILVSKQRRTRACRQSKICGRKTPQSTSRWAVEGRLRLPMGQRWESRKEREILRAVCRQKHPAALFIHVRSELGPSLSFWYVAGRWV